MTTRCLFQALNGIMVTSCCKAGRTLNQIVKPSEHASLCCYHSDLVWKLLYGKIPQFADKKDFPRIKVAYKKDFPRVLSALQRRMALLMYFNSS